MSHLSHASRALAGSLLSAAALTATALIVAAATAVVSVDNGGTREGKSSSFYASSSELLSIDYTQSTPSKVLGSGIISTGNTQDWTVWAWDGCEWSGTIFDAESPAWLLQVTWSGDLKADAVPNSGSSTHRAIAGQYAVLQGDVSGWFGQEYDVHYTSSNPGSTYSFDLSVGSYTYSFDGATKYDGAYSLIPGGAMISSGVWIISHEFEFTLFNRGWMTLKTNGSTSYVEAKVNANAGSWGGAADAWDLGASPVLWIETFPIS